MESPVAANPVSDPAESEHTWVRLIAQIALGNERALAELYDATSRIVYGLVLRIVEEPSAAEDVTLEVYMQVWRTAGTYSPARGTILSWLVTLARTRAIDLLRSRRVRAQYAENSTQELFSLPHPGPNPQDSSVQAGTARVVRKALTELPAEQREAIELAFFAGLTQSEIAERKSLPLGTVKTRIRLGMVRLRESLGLAGLG